MARDPDMDKLVDQLVSAGWLESAIQSGDYVEYEWTQRGKEALKMIFPLLEEAGLLSLNNQQFGLFVVMVLSSRDDWQADDNGPQPQ